MAFGEKAVRHAGDDALLFRGHAQFRQCRELRPDRSRAHSHKRQRLAVVADAIDFAFCAAAWHVIARHKNVTQRALARINRSAFVAQSVA